MHWTPQTRVHELVCDSGLNHVIGATGAEETFQQVAGFGFFDHGHWTSRMWFKPGGRGDGEHRPGTAGALVSHAEHEPLQAGEHDGAGAHGTGFFGDEERARFEPPITEGVGGLRDELLARRAHIGSTTFLSPLKS